MKRRLSREDVHLGSVDLSRLFHLAMDTKTMREALGPAWEWVLNMTFVETKWRRSTSGFGRCNGWWMSEARREAFNHSRGHEPARGVADFRTGRTSVITLNQTTLHGDRVQTIKTFLHEVCHLIPVPINGGRIPYHSRRFYDHLAAMLEELYPEIEPMRMYREGAPWRMYAYDRAMVTLMRVTNTDYLPRRPRPMPKAFVIHDVPTSRRLPTGRWLVDLEEALDVAERAEAAGWSLETFLRSDVVLFTPSRRQCGERI